MLKRLAKQRWKTGWDPIKKLRISLSGLSHAVLTDSSVARKLMLSTVMLVITFCFRQWIDVLMLFIVTGMMITAELFNTALETLCDLVDSRENEQIRITKDTAAAAVRMTELIWAVTLLVEVYRGVWEIISGA